MWEDFKEKIIFLVCIYSFLSYVMFAFLKTLRSEIQRQNFIIFIKLS